MVGAKFNNIELRIVPSMKISVIICTRNRSGLLKNAVDSVLSQDHGDYELWVVDDASGPGHQQKNEQIALNGNPRSRYLLLPPGNPKGNGLPVGRNAGVAVSQGEIVAFLDDDDRWSDASFLRLAAEAFSMHTDMDFLFADQEAWFNGMCVREHWQPTLRARLNGDGAGLNHLFILAKATCLASDVVTAQMNVCMFRRSFLQGIGGFNDKLAYGEDMEMYVRAADAARRIGFLDRVVAVHNRPDRKKNNNMSSLAETQKCIIGIGIANNLMCICKTKEAYRYARHWAAADCRDLARLAAKAWGVRFALMWAVTALSYRWTLKWFLYTTTLAFRALFSTAVRS